MRRVYVDTNVFLDFWLDRMAGLKPANYYAGEFFRKCVKCLYKIVISESVVFEFNENFPSGDIDEKLEIFRELDKLEVVSVKKEDVTKARELARDKSIPVHDAVHALIAKRLDIVLVTRDNHFRSLSDLIIVKTPEEL